MNSLIKAHVFCYVFVCSLAGQSVYELSQLIENNRSVHEDHIVHLGNHIIAEFMGCTFQNLNDFEHLEDILRQAAEAAHATIIEIKVHKFSPHGMSGWVLLAESHISIHTWPEYGYTAIDTYTCGEHVDTQATIDKLKEFFKPKHIQQIKIKRGYDRH